MSRDLGCISCIAGSRSRDRKVIPTPTISPPPSSYFDVDSNEAEPGTLAVANMNSLPRSPDRVSCRGSTFDTYDMDEMGTGRTFWTNTGQDGFAFMCDLRGHRTYESVVYPCPIILADCFATLCHVM